MQRLEDIIHQPNWKIILSDIVKESGFDIWNIDLISLTDSYLSRIKKMKDENLIIPANALLAAAILLKLKAYTLKLTSIQEEDDFKIPTEDQLLEDNLNFDNPIRLKKGQVSLDELVDVVDYIMNKPTKLNINRKIKEKEDDFILPKKNEQINIRIEKLFNILKNNVDRDGCITFSNLIKNNNSFEPFNLVNNYFIPLLFLSQDKKINIWQDDFFSDIFIKLLN
jgi:segregation and condensation protein A